MYHFDNYERDIFSVHNFQSDQTVFAMKFKIAPSIIFFGFAFFIASSLAMAEDEHLTIAVMPDFVTTAAPLDERQILNMACVFSTSDAEEIRNFRKAISSGRESDTSTVPHINFRQAVILEKGDSKEELFIKMKMDQYNEYFIKKYHKGAVSALRINSDLWNDVIKHADIKKYTLVQSPRGLACTNLTIFLNQKQ